MPAKAPSPKTNARSRRKSLRLHGTIARDLGVMIVSGRYKPGEIMNGEIAASDRLRFEPIGEVTLKGFPSPTSLYVVRGA